MEKEIWKPIPGYEEFYSVSNTGNIRRDKVVPGCRAGRILKPNRNRSGYKYVVLTNGSRKARKTLTVHNVVMHAFVGPKPNERSQINHIDGNKENNNLTNLEYVNQREHTLHTTRNKLHAHGTRVNTCKLSEEQVREIKYFLKLGCKTTTLAKEYGVSQSAIALIKGGRNWKHI